MEEMKCRAREEKNGIKKISVTIPCYNEEENVYEMYAAVTELMQRYDGIYDYEILFSDNDSTDGTRAILRNIAEEDRHVKVIMNARNFGPERSGWNSMFRAAGDVVVNIPCDFQAPPELILQGIKLWEEGSLIVCGQKRKSRENKIKFFLRQVFYGIIKLMSDVKQYDNLTGLILMDRTIMEAVRAAYEPGDEFRFLIADLGYKIRILQYEQQKRRAGKSSYNMARCFDFAITSLVNTSWVPLRLATVAGVLVSAACFLLGVVYFVYKLVHWDTFDAGIAPLLIGMFFIGSVPPLFIGSVGEYVGSVLRKISKDPLVVEEETINFDE